MLTDTGPDGATLTLRHCARRGWCIVRKGRGRHARPAIMHVYGADYGSALMDYERAVLLG